MELLFISCLLNKKCVVFSSEKESGIIKNMNNNQEEIMVSVCCATYNHQKYLPKALDGILMQKVNFPIEVIIAEDCSTDDSRKVIDEYDRNNPGKFKIIYRDHNVGAEKNFNDAYKTAKGKYMIILETDDYWTDPMKLQIQFDFLEHHPDVIATTHLCEMVDENCNLLPMKYPSIKKGFYTLKDYRNDIMPGQTTTMMFRNYYRDNIFDYSLLTNPNKVNGPGDRRRYFILASRGKIYCLPKVMSAYRFVMKSGSSFSAGNSFNNNLNVKIEYYREFVDYSLKCGLSKEAYYTAVLLHTRAILLALLHRKKTGISIKKTYQLLKNSNYKLQGIAFTLKYLTKKVLGYKEYGVRL